MSFCGSFIDVVGWKRGGGGWGLEVLAIAIERGFVYTGAMCGNAGNRVV